MSPDTNIALFRGKQSRRTLHKDAWWFVIFDVLAALTDSPQPAGYVKDMRRRDAKLDKGWRQIATPLFGLGRRPLPKAIPKAIVNKERGIPF